MGYLRDWKNVISNPLNFFNNLDNNNFKKPTLFAIKTYAIAFLFSFLIMIIKIFFLKSSINNLISMFNIESFGFVMIIVAIGVMAIFIFPITLLLTWGLLYIVAFIIHLGTRLFGSKEDFQKTFQIYSYSTAPNLFAFIPYLNYILIIYSIILLVIGIKKVHGFSTLKSIGSISILLIIISLIIFLSL